MRMAAVGAASACYAWLIVPPCPCAYRSEYKKPFAGASHSKGIVLEKMCVQEQQRSSSASSSSVWLQC